MEDKIERLKEYLAYAENIVFFGGAGVSTESGVPDFRSADGLYNQHDVHFEGYQPEYLLSHDCLVNEPEVFFEFYRQKMDTRNIEPNAAHRYLAKLEAEGKLKAVVTQNIDGLHQKAGSKAVYEIHGTTKKTFCMKCQKPYPYDYIFESDEAVPRCECGGIIRCGVTLYGEMLPREAVEGATEAISEADLLIIGGTSLTVYPAAGFVDYYRGKRRVIINKQKLSIRLDPENDLEINAPIGEVFSKLQ